LQQQLSLQGVTVLKTGNKYSLSSSSTSSSKAKG
jgi:hypothetical protein